MTTYRHILFITPFGLRHKTTVWARTLPLARELVKQGYRCTILIPPWDSGEDGGLCMNLDGVEVVHVNVEGALIGMVRRLWREATMRRPDVIHCIKPMAHAGILQWLLWWKRRLTGKGPVICLDMDDWEQAWLDVNNYPAPVKWFMTWQEEWGIRHADAITAASRWLEARAQAYAPKTPILYLPNGVEFSDDATTTLNDTSGTARQTSTPPPADASVFDDATIHGRSYNRNVTLGETPQMLAYGEVLLQAFDREQDAPPPAEKGVLYFTRFVEVSPVWFAAYVNALGKRVPDVRLAVAGSALQNNGEQAFVDALAPENKANVSFLGYVPRNTLPLLYAGAQVAIFPAEPTILQQAKCSVRLATTLLHGLPVVASAVGEQANYGAEASASLLPADATPEQFADATAALLADEDARMQMVANARRHLEANYHWSALATRLAELYAKLGSPAA